MTLHPIPVPLVVALFVAVVVAVLVAALWQLHTAARRVESELLAHGPRPTSSDTVYARIGTDL